MFNFGVERGIIDASPCVSIKMIATENRRDRVLTEGEIKILWKLLDQKNTHANPFHLLHMSEQTKLVLKLQLLLAQRKGEIISAEWSEIDINSGWWTIPGSKSKNSQTHRVPVSTLAIELLEKVKKLSGSSRFLFPSKMKNSHITGSAIDHAVRRSFFNGVGQWTPHDLRRSAASYMTSMGVPRLVVSKILNHTENSVTAVYDRYSYDREKKEAMDLWPQKPREIVYSDSL